jgi:cell division control protein 6
MDPRVKSSLSEEELIFPPYNAIQLQEILKLRADTAFKKETIQAGVIQKCAAYAAREHGDARRALELLRVAGEIAERQDEQKVQIKHIDDAEDKIEKERIFELVTTQPKQFQTVLYTAILINKETGKKFFTGDVYELYREICNKSDLRPLTQRRVSDVLAELDMLGILNAKVISKGRFGRTKEISLAMPTNLVNKITNLLTEELNLN